MARTLRLLDASVPTTSGGSPRASLINSIRLALLAILEYRRVIVLRLYRAIDKGNTAFESTINTESAFGGQNLVQPRLR